MKQAKKKSLAVTTIFVAAACCAALCACGDDKDSRSVSLDSDMYKVSYFGGEGVDLEIEERVYKAGTEISVARNTVEYADHTFSGWRTGNDIYKPGEKYIVPEHDTLFTAVWNEIKYSYPVFGQESYSYDRWGANDLEITLDLDGADLCYVEIDGETLFSTDWRYDEGRGCLVIKESYALSLADGEYNLVVITDSAEAGAVSCKLTVDNSVKTSFDEVREKTFRYGFAAGAEFMLDRGSASVTELLCEDVVLDAAYYAVDEDRITVKSEWLKHFCGDIKFKVKLDNYDSYEFTVKTDIIFASDYDINTIHDTTESNTGANSLYQYYDNVSIVDAPSSMGDGKVLKITPNTEEVPLDCNGYMTLCTQEFAGKTTWRNGTFVPGKQYFVAFDYMTENTSTGTLVYKDPFSGWSRQLAIGAENDGVVRHFEVVVNGDELEHGLYLYAYFPGGGNVYIDNFFVSECDIPVISDIGEYLGLGPLSFTIDDKGLDFVLDIDGETLGVEDYTYDKESGECNLSPNALSDLVFGAHTVGIRTAFGVTEKSFDFIDGRVSELRDTRVAYASETDTEVKVYGSFSEGLELTSLVQKVKTYNKKSENSVYDDWNFSAADTKKNYKDSVSLTTGDENNGYITLPKAFLDLFWGETEFEVSFDNGKRASFTLVSDVLFFTNYDDTTIFGFQGDKAVCGSPINSGLNNDAVAGIENSGEEGNNALVIRKTDDAQDPSAFTVRFREHVWDWFYTKAVQNTWLRITFDYQISGLDEDSVYFYIMGTSSEDITGIFFGDYDEVATLGWVEIRYHLKADGQRHTFDSGWFLYPDDSVDCRMTRIALPRFSQEDGKFIMFDNYRIVQAANVQQNFLDRSYTYEIGQETPFEIAVPRGVTVSRIEVDGEQVGFTAGDGKITLAAAALDETGKGLYNIAVYTDCGRFISSINVVLGGRAMLTEKSKNVVYGGGSVKLAGEFSQGITVTSIKRKGTDDYWDNTNTSGGSAVKTDGIMNVAYATVSPDGLTLSEALVNAVYKTMSYTVEFSNGVTDTFTLTSNLIRYTDYDETYVHQENGPNVETFQDTRMVSVEKIGEGNTALVYRPERAQEGHATGAINGGDGSTAANQWNAILTHTNERYVPNEWWHYLFPEGSTAFVFFDYEVVDPDDKSNYQFSWWDTSDSFHTTKLTGKGHFYLEISTDEMKRFFINCPVASPDKVAGTYMTIDNFGFGVKVTG